MMFEKESAVIFMFFTMLYTKSFLNIIFKKTS